MANTRNKIWFNDSTSIDCTIDDINKSLNDIGKHYSDLISFYPGVTSIELVEQGKDYVTIKNNEGTMKRTNISIEKSENKITVELDEEYITRAVKSVCHIVERFELKNDKIKLNIEINNHSAPGFLGFFLRSFGSKNIGKGFLDSYKKLLEK